MAFSFVGIGSNLGDRVENCLGAMREVARFASIEASSSLYETEPVGMEHQPYFINAVIRVNTPLSPYELLRALLGVESSMGRTRKGGISNAPRIIDLDILFYEDFIIESPHLVIPHPEAHKRRFVLAPLCEIAPRLVHPVLRRRSKELLEALQDGKGVSILAHSPNLPLAT